MTTRRKLQIISPIGILGGVAIGFAGIAAHSHRTLFIAVAASGISTMAAFFSRPRPKRVVTPEGTSGSPFTPPSLRYRIPDMAIVDAPGGSPSSRRGSLSGVQDLEIVAL
jgi:hypothetical protein